ncbi:hypothetical protein [Streptomyces alboflavus]|uniref:hypothetical protein n=1 Tax=Streptomyces alboflavus TaxID=67267 RepID=UPI00131EAA26
MSTPTHCPWCGWGYQDAALVQEFWSGDEQWFCCWCSRCERVADVGAIDRIVVTEAVMA